MLLSEGHSVTETILISVDSAATQGHGDIWVQAAAEGHVYVHGPTLGRVCVDACESFASGTLDN